MVEILGLDAPDLGDKRRNRRQVAILGRLAVRPDAPIPQAMGTVAETEAFYRMVENSLVEPDAMLQPHVDETCATVAGEAVFVIHDSTNIDHSTAQRADDTYDLGSGHCGYRAHLSLVVRQESGDPVGIIGMQLVEPKPPPPGLTDKMVDWYRRDHEGLRWPEQARLTQERLSGCDVVHLMDSEGDRYWYLQQMLGDGLRFIIRSYNQYRRVFWGHATRPSYLRDGIPSPAVRFTSFIDVHARPESPRQKKRNAGARSARQTQVEVTASAVSLPRPAGRPKEWSPQLSLNIVRIVELAPPEGEDPVEWWLWTTEPVDDESQVRFVIEAYKRRWLIEEFNKALKTGCQFVKRRFESKATSERALALFVPIAAGLLRLRALERLAPEQPAKDVLSPYQLLALKEFLPKSGDPLTIHGALLAVARMGGHLKSNGPPGWLVLGRGWRELELKALVWREAHTYFGGDVS